MGVSPVSGDARWSQRPSRVNRGFGRRTDGFDVPVRSRDGAGATAVCLWVDVPDLWASTKIGSAAVGKRQSPARRASLRRAFSELLGAPVRRGPGNRGSNV